MRVCFVSLFLLLLIFSAGSLWFYHSLIQDTKMYEKELANFVEYISRLEDKINQLKRNQTKIQETNETLAAKLLEVTQTLESTNQQLMERSEELEMAKENLLKSNKELEMANEDLLKSNKELEMSKENLSKRNKGLEIANEDLLKSNKELEMAKGDLLKSNKELEMENEKMLEAVNNQRPALASPRFECGNQLIEQTRSKHLFDGALTTLFDPPIKLYSASVISNDYLTYAPYIEMVMLYANLTGNQLSSMRRLEKVCLDIYNYCEYFIEGTIGHSSDPMVVHLVQPFIGYSINATEPARYIPMVFPSVREFPQETRTVVNVIVTVSTDLAGLFIQQQMPLFMKIWETDTRFKIIVVEFNAENESIRTTLERSGIPFDYAVLSGKFSRVKGLNKGHSFVSQEDEILFFTDVDMVFAVDFFNTIRNRVRKGETAYFPIPFYQRDGITNDTHPFPYSMGNAAMFKSDLSNILFRKIYDTRWGTEDISLAVDLRNAQVEIYRNYEPSLLHIYHPERAWRTDYY